MKKRNMKNSSSDPAEMKIAQTVRDACIREARQAFRDASMSGLCTEGAMEAAIGAMQSLDIEELTANIREGQSD